MIRRIKKFIFIFIAITWIFDPCVATATSHANKNAKQTTKASKHQVTHTKNKAAHHTNHPKKINSHHIQHAKKKAKTLPHHKGYTPATHANIDPNLIHSNCVIKPNTSDNSNSSMTHRVVEFVHKSLSSLKYSVYKMGGSHFDTNRGVYVLDCSSYVDHILREVHPDAYLSLVESSGAEKPNSRNYYDFFSELSYDQDDYWNKVEDIEQLQPGDILVFRYKNSHGAERGGHVMVVMDKPTRDEDAFMVRVADSAPAGHSEDTRPGRASGIGIGTLLLKVNPETGAPSAFAWKVGSRWQNNVNIAMARPLEITN